MKSAFAVLVINMNAAKIIFNIPDRMNFLDLVMREELKSAFMDIENDSDINDMYIKMDYPLDKDCKMDCPTWRQIFEIWILW